MATKAQVLVDRSARVRVATLPLWAKAAIAFFGYALLSLAIFARGVLASPSDTVIGDAGPDKTIYMWSLVWWPHALARGHDPFNADVIWAPHGIDLSWVTAVPGASLLGLPVTEAVGPVVAYNLLAGLAPALAGLTAFLLAHWLTKSFTPGLFAGYVFGFSPFMVGHMVGHLNLVLVFLVPVALLLVAKRFVGELRPRAFVPLLALTLVGQFLFSSEIFLTLTMVGILIALLIWWRFPRADRAQLGRVVLDTGLAYVLALMVLSPYLVHAVFIAETRAPKRAPELAAADVLNYVVPTRRTWVRPPLSDEIKPRFTSNGAEQGAYLGLPLLAIIGLFAWRRPRAPAVTVLLIALVLLALASVGPKMRVAGEFFSTGPWIFFSEKPVFRSVMPIRLTMYVALGAALIAALWLARERGPTRWVVAVVAAIALLPAPASRFWASEVPRSTFFEDDHYERFIDAGDTVLVFPYGPGGWSMLWQAEAGMPFRMIGGHVGHHRTRQERDWYPMYRAFAGVDLPPGFPSLRAFLVAHGARAVILGPGTRPKLRELVETLGTTPIPCADSVVYYVRRGETAGC